MEEGITENRSRSVISLQNFPADGDLRKPLEDLVEQTVRNNALFNTREALLNEEDPKAILFWAKTLSLHAKKLKSFYLRVKKGENDFANNKNNENTNNNEENNNEDNNNDNNYQEENINEINVNSNIINENQENNEDSELFHWSNNQIELVYIHFHATSIQKFELCSTLDPLNSFENNWDPTAYLPLTNSKGKKNRSKFPYMELCYEWGLALLRYGKALEMQRDFEAAYIQHKKAAILFMRVVYEDRRRKFTYLVFNKIIITFERLAKVKPTYTDVRTYCDLFLVQFSNIAMRGEMKQLNLKPMVAMCLSNSRHVRESNAIEVVRHLGKFFETEFGNEAAAQLGHLEETLSLSQDKETQLQKLLTAEALKRLEKSEIKKEEYLEHIEVIINLLQWKGKPPCRLSFSSISHNINSENWRRDNPKKLFRDQIKLSGDDCHSDAMVVLAKRKSDRLSVSIKIMKKFSEHEKEIYNEVAILDYFSNHNNFTHLLEVFLYRDEVWAVSEYSNAGNLVDVIPAAEMAEEEIAYISKEILTGLHFLHSSNRMHRDLTSDNILLNTSGEIMISDFEVYLGNSYQRYWLPPELLLSEPYPYATEVDIWAFGCIVYEMVDGHPPYSDFRPLKEFFYTATRGAPQIAKPHLWSTDFRHFISCAMHIDPKKRYTAAQLLEHPFIKKAYRREDYADALHMKISFFR